MSLVLNDEHCPAPPYRTQERLMASSHPRFSRDVMRLSVLRALACAPLVLVLFVPGWASPSAADFPSGTLAAHGPIFIDGNAELTANNGVTGGLGTAIDPHVIEGWDINASQQTGLIIENTDAYVVVRNVS